MGSHSPSGCRLRGAPQAARPPLPLGSRPAVRTLQAPGGPVGFWAGQDPVKPGLHSPAGVGRHPSSSSSSQQRVLSGSGPRAHPDSGWFSLGNDMLWWGTGGAHVPIWSPPSAIPLLIPIPPEWLGQSPFLLPIFPQTSEFPTYTMLCSHEFTPPSSGPQRAWK